MTAPLPTVCILTAGTGRRSGPFADIVNKCLLPYRGRAIISHIIDRFPAGASFVIALGYKAEQVRTYLTLMHPDSAFTFVEVDRYVGPGTGPGYSLSCCKDALPEPFYFVAGDGVFEHIPDVTDRNWLGVARPESGGDLTAYCNVACESGTGNIHSVYDKVSPPADVADSVAIFTGLMFIKDVQAFWASLHTNAPTTNEIQIAQGFKDLASNGQLSSQLVDWRDLGTFELYQNAQEEAFDFSKTEEFIYFSAARVVKFFANAVIAEQRVAKARCMPAVFPRLVGDAPQFYAYEKVKGKTAYEVLDARLIDRLLPWLKQSLWKPCDASQEQMETLCRSFYHEKTRKRVSAYHAKYPDFCEASTVNGRAVLPIDALLGRLPASLAHGVPVFIHGDLQFDNIITDGERFTLIDWRQDFAGQISFGDWYYDLAKLLGGIYLNYDYIKHGLMRFDQQGRAVWIDFAVREQAPAYAAQLQRFVEKEGLDFRRVEILRGLIYLNMAPLHHPPFDRLLYALAQVTLTSMLG